MLLDIQSSQFACQFDLHSSQHPFVFIIKQNGVSWSTVSSFIPAMFECEYVFFLFSFVKPVASFCLRPSVHESTSVQFGLGTTLPPLDFQHKQALTLKQYRLLLYHQAIKQYIIVATIKPPYVEFRIIILLHEWLDRGQMHQL